MTSANMSVLQLMAVLNMQYSFLFINLHFTKRYTEILIFKMTACT